MLYGSGWLNINLVDGVFLKLPGLSMTNVKKNALWDLQDVPMPFVPLNIGWLLVETVLTILSLVKVVWVKLSI